jgi:hypothetical protein
MAVSDQDARRCKPDAVGGTRNADNCHGRHLLSLQVRPPTRRLMVGLRHRPQIIANNRADDTTQRGAVGRGRAHRFEPSERLCRNPVVIEPPANRVRAEVLQPQVMLAVLLRVTETPEAPLDPVAGRRAGRFVGERLPRRTVPPGRRPRNRRQHLQDHRPRARLTANPPPSPRHGNTPSPWPSPARIGTTTTRQVWPLRRQARDRRSGAASTHRAPCCRCSHCVGVWTAPPFIRITPDARWVKLDFQQAIDRFARD